MPDFDQVAGDGILTWPESGLTLDEIKAELEDLARESADIWEKRITTDNTRLAFWENQSDDGLKHAVDEEEPEPFDGACDQKIRLADLLINEDVALLITAAMRARIKFSGVTEEDARKAAKLTILMRYVLMNIWGLTWIKELAKVANYYIGDTPAVALLKIYWKRETSLRLTNITAEELLEQYLQRAQQELEQSGLDEETKAGQLALAAQDFLGALQAPAATNAEYLQSILKEFFPHLRPRRAKQMIKQLRETGSAEYPEPYISANQPMIEGKRIWEEWFIPRNTGEFQEARVYFESDWLTKAQLYERITSEGWDQDFVEAVVGKDGEQGHEGESAVPEYTRETLNGPLTARDPSYYRGLYNIITAYFRALNDDGIPGRFYVVFHKDVKDPAKPPELINYVHGGYPGHVFQRETISGRMLDARGLGTLAASYQGLLKLYCDSFGDNAQLSGVPPMITRGRARMGALRLRPLGELPAKRDGDYKWLAPPQYPQTVVNMIMEIRRQVDDYFGRENKDNPPSGPQLAREFKVLWWLLNLREVLGQVFKLVQQFMPDEIIQRITNAQGQPLFAAGREEIQGQFDLELQFDPEDLDAEKMMKKGKMLKELVLAMDRSQQVDSGPIVEEFLYRLVPGVAPAAFKHRDQAVRDETQDETAKYQQIRAGMEPPLSDDGSEDYATRAAFYQQIQQANPEIFNDLPPDKAAILQSRIQRLQFLAQQYGANAQIGRQGAPPALEDRGQRTEVRGQQEEEGWKEEGRGLPSPN
ncbi:MAG: hypothetical protein PHX05_00130 [Acidobacteriota bacterium]|nr:hypothetical protein [Acidobacteriota bacterium]